MVLRKIHDVLLGNLCTVLMLLIDKAEFVDRRYGQTIKIPAILKSTTIVRDTASRPFLMNSVSSGTNLRVSQSARRQFMLSVTGT